MKLKLATLCGLVFAAFNASACYTVFDSNNRVVYQGDQAPVDMSLPLQEALAQRYPRGGVEMVFDQQATCREMPMTRLTRSASTDLPVNSIRMERTNRVQQVSNAPLFTDRRTATALNLPHQVVEGQIVMVPAQAAARVNLPTLTVVPATEVARAPAAPMTSAMGAGPVTMPMPRTANGTVITEMHNPPLTGVQRGDRLTVIQ